VTEVAKADPGSATALPAGEFSEWLRQTRRAQALRVIGADVACGTCNACCRSSYFIHVRPEETETLRRIPRSLQFPAPGLPRGNVLLGFNQHGQCPMLIDDRCSIYDHRPQTCRDYDCRVFAATGIDPGKDVGRAQLAERVRQWTFIHRDDAARAAQSAVQAAAAFLQDHRDSFPPDALPGNPVQLAVLAIEVHEVFAELSHGATRASAQTNTEIAEAVLALMEVRRPPAAAEALAEKPGARRGRHRDPR
jgi:uncharacterized protein